jgi:hypothetical protein
MLNLVFAFCGSICSSVSALFVQKAFALTLLFLLETATLIARGKICYTNRSPHRHC